MRKPNKHKSPPCVNSERRELRTRTRNQSNTIRTHTHTYTQEKENIRIVEANTISTEKYMCVSATWLGFINYTHTAILDVFSFSTHNIYRSIQFRNAIDENQSQKKKKTIIEPTRMK